MYFFKMSFFSLLGKSERKQAEDELADQPPTGSDREAECKQADGGNEKGGLELRLLEKLTRGQITE